MTTTTERSALPGHIIDRIRDGVPRTDLKAKADRAVYQALVSTAASAQQRGWGFVDWTVELKSPRSHLYRQASIRRGKERTPRAVNKLLDDAWEAATTWLAERAAPAFTRQDVAIRIEAVRLIVEDADYDIPDTDRAVLDYACTVAQRNGTTRPAVPRREIAKATGLGERTIRTVLARLDELGVLPAEAPGRSGTQSPRARLVRLPAPERLATAYLCRETRPVGPLARPVGPHPPTVHGTPARPVGPPPRQAEKPQPIPSTDEEQPVQEIRLTREQILQALGTAAFDELMAAVTADQPAEPDTDNVVPFTRAAHGSSS